MRHVSTADFMQRLFAAGPVSRASIVSGLFDDADVAAIASEHGVRREALVRAASEDEGSEAGARMREAVARMRSGAPALPSGAAFPPELERATDGGLELVGLFVNPMMTAALILKTPMPPLEQAGRAIDPLLSLAAYASRVFRVLAVEHPDLSTPLSNAAAALERA